MLIQIELEELGSMYTSTIWSGRIFHVLIACINYINLTTARSARRPKEIGIRKVTGSIKFKLDAVSCRVNHNSMFRIDVEHGGDCIIITFSISFRKVYFIITLLQP